MKMEKKANCIIDKMKLWVLILLSASAQKVSCIDFVEPSLVISVQNGSTSGLVVDCPYELSDNDTHGLEVKWYFKEKPTPVYQWIPGNTPQDLGRLSGRLNLSYQASSDKYKKHRALAILEPTSELSGHYRCTVSTFQGDENFEATLTVYTPATEFNIMYERMDTDSVMITCLADGLFPEPTLGLYRMISSTGTYRSEDAGAYAEFIPENGTFSIALEKEVQHVDLQDENEFLCSLTIPKTEYQVDRKIFYYPAGAESKIGNCEAYVVMWAAAVFFSSSLLLRS